MKGGTGIHRFVRFAATAALAALCLPVAPLHAQNAKYWIGFRDKGNTAVSAETAGLSPRALERRISMLGTDKAVTIDDMPLWQPYIDALVSMGIPPVVRSKWMNAVSAYLTEAQLAAVRQMPFVASVTPVITWQRGAPLDEPLSGLPKASDEPVFELDYGSSLQQLAMLDVPRLHAVWIDGTGALIGMLDNGYGWRNHEALYTRKVLGEYDFINKDSVTSNEAGDPAGQDSHGTSTFSAVGGFMEGKLIGTAYNAEFYLAKTEVNDSETPVEEDYWVEGIEWLESLGIDVVSSSLGYDTFDGGEGYSFENGDFDGQTAVTTRAAARAARLGVVVCTATGNEGSEPQNLIAPSDADTVISVGAVTYQNFVASFSSSGPTNDGRTKPDVVAPGISVYNASVSGGSAYGFSSGTSMSTPLVAGIAAMVRSTRPELTPLEVRNTLRETADFAAAPQQRRGWGLVRAWDAVLHHGLVFSTNPRIYHKDGVTSIALYALSRNPVGNVDISYSIDGGPETVTAMRFIEPYPGLGSGSGLYYTDLPALETGARVRWYVRSSDRNGPRTAPYNAPESAFEFQTGYTNPPGGENPFAFDFELYQNYPNPVDRKKDGGTYIRYMLPRAGDVTIHLYDMLGRRVGTIVNGARPRGVTIERMDTWDISRGAYYYTLDFEGQRQTRRLYIAN